MRQLKKIAHHLFGELLLPYTLLDGIDGRPGQSLLEELSDMLRDHRYEDLVDLNFLVRLGQIIEALPVQILSFVKSGQDRLNMFGHIRGTDFFSIDLLKLGGLQSLEHLMWKYLRGDRRTAVGFGQRAVPAPLVRPFGQTVEATDNQIQLVQFAVDDAPLDFPANAYLLILQILFDDLLLTHEGRQKVLLTVGDPFLERRFRQVSQRRGETSRRLVEVAVAKRSERGSRQPLDQRQLLVESDPVAPFDHAQLSLLLAQLAQ